MMKPPGSPPTCVSSLPVAGFFQSSSLECSARVIVILMSGPSGVTVPPLFMRGTRLAGSTPSVSSVWLRPPGAKIGTLCFFARSGASPMWSTWACVTRITTTLPLTEVSLVAACPSHCSSILPGCCAPAGPRPSATTRSAAITSFIRIDPSRRCSLAPKLRSLYALTRTGGGIAMATIEQSIEVNAPLRAVYNQWTQFEDFPRFMEGVKEVRQLDDKRLHWRAVIGGKEKEWDAEIVEQRPDERIAWTSRGGVWNAGVVTFHRIDDQRTKVMLQVDYEPQGVVENVADALGVVSARVKGDLERFEEFIERRGRETGAWRGEIQHGQVDRRKVS